MPNPNLTVNEIRIVGSLMEKAVTTPEQCPLTLNALTLACNQKSRRDPVLALGVSTPVLRGADAQGTRLISPVFPAVHCVKSIEN